MALRHEKLWIAIGAAGLAALIYLSLTPRPHHVVRVSLGLFQIGDKIEHVAAFLVPTYWFGQIYHRPRNHQAIALLLILLGAMLEYLQWKMSGYRMIEYGDIAASTAGVFAGYLLLQTRAGSLLRHIDSLIARKAP